MIIFAVIYDDASARYTKAHLTHEEALADGGRYARERFETLRGRPMHKDSLASDADSIDEIQSFADVSMEIETINVPDAVVRELFARLSGNEKR